MYISSTYFVLKNCHHIVEKNLFSQFCVRVRARARARERACDVNPIFYQNWFILFK